MHHQIKCSRKEISSSVDMVETVISDHMSPPCDPEQDSKTSFLHDTVSSLVTERSAVEEILSRRMFTGILNLFCGLDLDHDRAIQSFHKTI